MSASTSGAGGGAGKGVQTLSVHNGHCHFYGICQQEAPEVFSLGEAGRLHYTAHPAAEHAEKVRQAVRLCPMQAIELHEAST